MLTMLLPQEMKHLSVEAKHLHFSRKVAKLVPKSLHTLQLRGSHLLSIGNVYDFINKVSDTPADWSVF